MKSRPYPVAVLPFDHPQLQPFKNLPKYEGYQLKYQLLGIAPVVAVILLVLGAFKANLIPSTGWLGGVLSIPPVVLGFWGSLVLTRHLGFRYMLYQKDRDGQTLGEAQSGERYVGIAYCDGAWGFRQDTSWDRGFIGVDSGELYFRGFGPGFRLPLTWIETLEIHETKSFSSSLMPRLYVGWRDGQGNFNTFSLEVRDGLDIPTTSSKTEELTGWLQNEARNARPLDRVDEGGLPFRSCTLDFNRVPSAQNVKASDRVIAFIAAFVFSVVVLFFFTLTKIDSGFISGIVGVAAIAVYNGLILHKVKSRSDTASTDTP